jgi:hypothetical protein
MFACSRMCSDVFGRFESTHAAFTWHPCFHGASPYVDVAAGFSGKPSSGPFLLNRQAVHNLAAPTLSCSADSALDLRAAFIIAPALTLLWTLNHRTILG